MNPNVPPANFSQAPPPYFQGANPAAGHPMMALIGNSQGAIWFASILWFITWILVIAILAALFRLIWIKADNQKKR